MSDIGIIVNSEEMYELAFRLSKETSYKTKVILSRSYEDSIMWARKLEDEGYKLLISRGGYGERIRASGINLPVVDIPVSIINVLSPFVHAVRSNGKIAVIGYQYLLNVAQDLAKDFDREIQCYLIDTFDDFETHVAKAKENGATVVVGGYHAVHFAEAAGLKGFCVEMRELEFEVALEEATKVLRILENEKAWNELFRTILDSIQEGIISVDRTGAVTHINNRATAILGVDGKSIIGRQIDEPVINSNLEKTLKDGKYNRNEIDAENNCKYVFSTFPILVGSQIIGGVVVIQEVKYVQKIEQQIRRKLSQRGLVAQHTFSDILGGSFVLREAIEKAKQYSLVDSTVLICGKSGTGKEIFAQSIHNHSLRKKEAFVAINCASIPQELLESELFGYVEGAFTGAKRGGKVGLFELAHNGTIFLDEIGEIGKDMQTRLLRVLEEKQIRRIGDDKIIPVNIRVIAATNRDLQAMVKNGEFREDFYYRLNVLSLLLPPLKDRREDIEPLVQYFQQYYSTVNNIPVRTILPEAIEVLMEYDWPGNVRELRNVLERLMVLNQYNDIGYSEALSVLSCTSPMIKSKPKPTMTESHLSLIDKNERDIIKQILYETGGNKAEAARRLGICRATLYRKLKEMELD